MTKYGSGFYPHKRGLMLVINGYMFSVFVGFSSKKLQAAFNKNIWRKTNTPCPN